MSDIDLDAIEARANAATPGPWLVLRGMDCTHVRAQDGHFETGCINWDGRDASDADFIAAARTDIPALIARVREQEQEIAKLREVVAFFACTIRSGEPWSEACQQALDECQP